jgi:hypothetical protein
MPLCSGLEIIGSIASLLLLEPLAEADKPSPEPLPAAHAHNDFEHRRPLLDALDHGFTSVEADIHLVDGKLLVGHDRADLVPERTLEALYLEPLLERARSNGGRIYRGGPELTLLVDIKADGEAAYAALKPVFEKYAEILSVVRDGKLEVKAVRIVLSGDRPIGTVSRESTRFAAIDGRSEDLVSKDPAHLLPLISESWGRLFEWRGEGPIPVKEREKLRGIVKDAHARGRRVRFWATPEKEAVWKELFDAGVDLINTDDLKGLQAFLLARRKADGRKTAPGSP